MSRRARWVWAALGVKCVAACRTSSPAVVPHGSRMFLFFFPGPQRGCVISSVMVCLANATSSRGIEPSQSGSGSSTLPFALRNHTPTILSFQAHTARTEPPSSSPTPNSTTTSPSTPAEGLKSGTTDREYSASVLRMKSFGGSQLPQHRWPLRRRIVRPGRRQGCTRTPRKKRRCTPTVT
jgi:hypothetical protein